MSQTSSKVNHTPLVVLGLAMALGPLTALSVGSRIADEETFARAQAGAENIKRRAMQAASVTPVNGIRTAATSAGALQTAPGRDS